LRIPTRHIATLNVCVLYKHIIRPILFQLNPEAVHDFVTGFLQVLLRVPGLLSLTKWMYRYQHTALEREVMGLKFRNPIGLAAGFDKDGMHTKVFGAMGFGFVEVGTVTPRPQPGNPKPRLFRLRRDHALINRMGFNSSGVEKVRSNLFKRDRSIIVGGNIGKNKTTPNDEAIRDYEICFERLFDYVDYFVVNVSSPNTPGLRHLQERKPLWTLLKRLKDINSTRECPRPILLKIAPDLTEAQLDDIIDIVTSLKIDGIVATNTTVERAGLKTSADKVVMMGDGGLSGQPLKRRSTEIIRYIRKHAPDGLIIIGAGGVATAEDAREKLEAGADLLQVYTGFIYEGPATVRKINRGISGL
jgi:dihydroorotate dehydrogenase